MLKQDVRWHYKERAKIDNHFNFIGNLIRINFCSKIFLLKMLPKCKIALEDVFRLKEGFVSECEEDVEEIWNRSKQTKNSMKDE